MALFALFIAIANVNAEILSEPFYPNDNERTIKWTFDTETGVLTLSGAGATPNYTQEAPFGHEKGFKVKKLVVEEGVTIINNYFLYGASSLQEITISSSVFFAIWDYVFSNCTALTTVKIDKSKNENGIGFLKEAFAGCTALTNIEIAEAQEYVNFGEKSFSGCTALKTLKLNEPKKGISFDGESFAGCTH